MKFLRKLFCRTPPSCHFSLDIVFFFSFVQISKVCSLKSIYLVEQFQIRWRNSQARSIRCSYGNQVEIFIVKSWPHMYQIRNWKSKKRKNWKTCLFVIYISKLTLLRCILIDLLWDNVITVAWMIFRVVNLYSLYAYRWWGQEYNQIIILYIIDLF